MLSFYFSVFDLSFFSKFWFLVISLDTFKNYGFLAIFYNKRLVIKIKIIGNKNWGVFFGLKKSKSFVAFGKIKTQSLSFL